MFVSGKKLSSSSLPLNNMELFYNLLLPFLSFLCFVSLLFPFYKHKSRFTPTGLPPGNTGFPFVGETLHLHSAGKKGLPENFFLNRMATFSSRVFKTSLLGEPTAVLCGTAGNKLLFSNENKLFTSWIPPSMNKIFSSSFQDSSSEEASKKLRNLLPQFLKPESLQKYIGIMDTIAQTHFDLDWKDKEEVRVAPVVKKYTFGLACRLFLSIEDPNLVDKYAHPFHDLASGMVSIPINLPGTPFNGAIRASRFIRKEIRKIITRRRRNGSTSSDEGDLLSHMLLATDENGKHMSEMDIEDKIIGVLIAGHETASVAITFTLNYLAQLPHIYLQVFHEQMEIAKLKGPGELLNWEDIQKMKYSWSVASEVMRLVPPAQGGFREALHDFNFAGFSIPKGWKVYWSVHTTHKNPECFSEPDNFDPTRFEGSGPPPYSYVPFGAGPKMCPGKEYARLEILVFIHNIVKRFKWDKLIPDEAITVDPFPTFAQGLPIRIHSLT